MSLNANFLNPSSTSTNDDNNTTSNNQTVPQLPQAIAYGPSQCASYPPEADTTNAGQMGQMILKHLAAASGGCDMDSFSASLAGSYSGPLGMGNANLAATVGNLKKSGCQALSSVVGNYLNSVYQAKCIITNDSQTAWATVSSDQLVSSNAYGPNSNVDYGGVICTEGTSITMTSKISAKIFTNISSTASAQISNVISQGLKNTVAQLQTQNEGFQGTESGANALTTLNNAVKTATQSSAINNAVNGAVTTISNTQTVTRNAFAGGHVVVPCVINLDSVMDIQIASIVTSAYTGSIQSALTSYLTGAVKQSVELKSQGAPNPMDIFKSNWMYIVGVIAVVILGFFLMKFMKSKNGAALINKVGKNPELSA